MINPLTWLRHSACNNYSMFGKQYLTNEKATNLGHLLRYGDELSLSNGNGERTLRLTWYGTLLYTDRTEEGTSVTRSDGNTREVSHGKTVPLLRRRDLKKLVQNQYPETVAIQSNKRSQVDVSAEESACGDMLTGLIIGLQNKRVYREIPVFEYEISIGRM